MQRTRTPRHRGTSRKLPKITTKRKKAKKFPDPPGFEKKELRGKRPGQTTPKTHVGLANKGNSVRDNLLKTKTSKTGGFVINKQPKLKPVRKIKTTGTKITGSIKALKQKAKNRRATNKRFENENTK